MSTENLQKFLDQVAADPALQAKVQEVLTAKTDHDFAMGLAQLSAEQSLPVAEEDFRTRGRAYFSDQLDPAQLDAISGGQYTIKNPNSPFGN